MKRPTCGPARASSRFRAFPAPRRNATYLDTYDTCKNNCPLKVLNSADGFKEVKKTCDDLECQGNPYCEEPTPPTPSPVTASSCTSLCEAYYGSSAPSVCTACPTSNCWYNNGCVTLAAGSCAAGGTVC